MKKAPSRQLTFLVSPIRRFQRARRRCVPRLSYLIMRHSPLRRSSGPVVPNGDQNEIPSEARVRVLASISLEHNIKWFRVGLELDSIAFCSISIAILKVEIFLITIWHFFPELITIWHRSPTSPASWDSSWS